MDIENKSYAEVLQMVVKFQDLGPSLALFLGYHYAANGANLRTLLGFLLTCLDSFMPFFYFSVLSSVLSCVFLVTSAFLSVSLSCVSFFFSLLSSLQLILNETTTVVFCN
jgi:hypothetical protein